MHELLVHILGPRPGERWLDIGCGAGNVAELAAGAGAHVTGIDLSPRLVEVAKARAAAGSYDIEYRVGDAESLDVEDESFDVVVSTVGLIFAPDHHAVARELARVTRRGGRLGVSAWTPEGTVGAMVERLAPFQPPPPEGAGTPLQWGIEPHVRSLLGGAFELRVDRRISAWEEESAERAFAIFSKSFGPTKTLLESLPPDRAAELERTIIEFFAQGGQPGGRIVDRREYLLVTGIRR